MPDITVQREKMVPLFEALGFDKAQAWNAKRLQMKLKELPDMLKGSETVRTAYDDLDNDMKTLCDEATAIIDRGDSILISEKKEKVLKNGKPPSKGGKKEKAEKAEKAEKVAPPKDNDTPRDRFGARLGTDAARAGAVLSTEPKTESQIRKECGARNTVEYLLDKYVRLGYLSWKEGVGYALTKNAPR